MNKKSIVWIRDDFRLNRNPSLAYATKNHEFVSAIFIYNKIEYDYIREAQKWWLSKSLDCFQLDLKKFNINLEILPGDELKIFSNIKKKDEISLYWNRVYEPKEIRKEKILINHLEKNNINFKFFKGNLLNEFQEVKKDDGTPFKVFTPFWKRAEKIYLDKVPMKISKIKKLNKSFFFFDKKILPKEILPKKKWFEKFSKYWDPSENKGIKKLEFLLKNKIEHYGERRDFPNIDGTSKISPYLKHGQTSVEEIWDRCNQIKIKGKGYRKYINELGWREFSHSLINNFPEMLKGNLRKEFDKFPWVNNIKFLSAWKKGMTGYPIVDAGMRELYETGWMHNRVRMIVASFLVKHLRIHWKEGEKHFRNCLLDFNEANNVAQWQWVAGCGADAAPYFRIFNPILQGEKFDKNGEYTKKWVPELKKIPVEYVHKPWELEKEIQENIKLIIGKDYPFPIVNHEKARNEALEAFQSLKKK